MSTERQGPCRGYRATHCKGEFVGPAGEKASPRSCNTLFLQCAALGLGEGEEGNSCQGSGEPGPLTVRVSSMKRGICLLSKGNSSSPSLHTATSRAIVPDAAVATVTTSSQLLLLPLPPLLLLLLPPPPNSCLQQPNAASFSTRRRAAHSPRGGGREAGGDPRVELRFPSPDSTRAQPISAQRRRDPPPRPAFPPHPPPRPVSTQGPERRKGLGGPRASPACHWSPSSRTSPQATAPQPTARFPPPGTPQLTPFSPFLGAPRPVSPLGCSCSARPRPWEGSTPPRLCGGQVGRFRPFPHRSQGDLSALTSVCVVASLTPTFAPRYRLTRPASGPAWAGEQRRMPFPLRDQPLAPRGVEEGGRWTWGGWGREGRRTSGGAPPPLARL